MVGFSYWNHPFWIAFPAMICHGKTIHSPVSPPMDSFRPIATRVSGSRWIPCARKTISKISGTTARPPGGSGNKRKDHKMTSATVNSEFWKGRRVLLTGHTGFKGAWAAAWLAKMGAEVTGVSLAADGVHSLYNSIQDHLPLTSHFIDIRDADALTAAVRDSNPEIVLHMAAQALVRRSYREPVYTYETNVMGTVNLLEALRELPELKAALIITSDKVYQNNEDGRAFTETDPLGGDAPYSSSKEFPKQ